MYSVLNTKIDEYKISQLIEKLGYLLKEFRLEIDSRKLDQKSIFCAYKGAKADGRDYILEAKNLGVRCIIEDGEFNLKENAHYYIEYLRDIVGILASVHYNNPSRRLKIIGVTGTNGKTSITQWLAQVLCGCGKKVALVGTLGAGVYPAIKDYASTTPDPITLENLLSGFAMDKVDSVAMEVSSHALDQGRVNGIAFNLAVFTNLTQDHLDYHHSMEEYYLAKKELFFWKNLKYAVINIDDSYGSRLYNELNSEVNGLKSSLRIITYGFDDGDLTAVDVKIGLDGVEFSLCYKNQQVVVQVEVIGRFNVYNLLATAGVLLAFGYQFYEIPLVLKSVRAVKGRMEAIIKPNRPLVVIDYAHTPDALKKVLQSLHEVEHRGKIYCVFGCGGDRDKTKRGIMGRIAVENADYAIITTDNPRTENPQTIIGEILEGIDSGCGNYYVEVDRKKAIKYGISKASSNDIILIAGKGHEEYQEINGIKEYFSDFGVANELLAESL